MIAPGGVQFSHDSSASPKVVFVSLRKASRIRIPLLNPVTPLPNYRGKSHHARVLVLPSDGLLSSLDSLKLAIKMA